MRESTANKAKNGKPAQIQTGPRKTGNQNVTELRPGKSYRKVTK